MKRQIVIAGGTGFVGKRLADMFREKGDTVRILTRTPNRPEEYYWDPSKGELDPAGLDGAHVVINLAGAGIAEKRWTADRKRVIIESRVQSNLLLCKEIGKMPVRPQVFLTPTAVGIYGNSGDTPVDETCPAATKGFMPECCVLWEEAAKSISGLGIRTVVFRMGIVLAKEGGALKELIMPLRWGLGAYFGNGQAWWPWIHRDDACRAFVWAVENPSVNGIFNLVAPQPERGKALSKTLVDVWQKPALVLPVPAFALRIIFGEMAAALLNSNKVSAQKLMAAGFTFQYPALKPALQSILAPPIPSTP